MQNILNDFNINARVTETIESNYSTKYYIQLCSGTRIKDIEKYIQEIALLLKAIDIPIITPKYSLGVIEIEIIKSIDNFFNFNEIKDEFINHSKKSTIPILLGKEFSNNNLLTIDLVGQPHILIGGSTGSGKSIQLHNIICGILSSNCNTKLILIDPKKVEFAIYKNIKNLIFPISSEIKEVNKIFEYLNYETTKRFKYLSKKSCTNLLEYNNNYSHKIPFITVIIDEFAELNSEKYFIDQLCKLAQKTRACGIHFIIATQRPSVNNITGDLKSNFTTRICGRVGSIIDSKIVFDYSGAEKLTGKGDSLINSAHLNMIRFRSSYISTEEIKLLCKNKKVNYFNRLLKFITNK